jgi:hypothetical protein
VLNEKPKNYYISYGESQIITFTWEKYRLSTSNLKASEDPKRFWISGFRFTDQGCPASEASEVYFVNIPKSETLSVSKHFR